MNRKERRAAAKRSGGPDALFAIADACHDRGQVGQALDAYERGLKLNPAAVRPRHNFALLLEQQGRSDAAMAQYRLVIKSDPKLADAYNNLAVLVRRTGDRKQALDLYLQALAARPDFPLAHNNLGSLYAELGRFAEAQAHYDQALTLQPDYIECRINLGQALLDQERSVDALDQAEVLCAAAEKPGFAHYYRLGVFLARCGIAEGAKICLLAHLRQHPEDRDEVGFLLAKLGCAPLPARAPAAELDRLYAERAHTWDDGGGNYRGADMVAGVLLRLADRGGPLDILDAGCGTGLVGRLVADRARTLTGVDLSGPMLEKAKSKEIYHALHNADLVAFLNDHPGSFDAVTCAATLIHFGDLRPAFEAAARGLRPGGLFAFTLFPNQQDENGVAIASIVGMAKGGCYEHGRSYVAALAAATGFAVEHLESEIHEHQYGRPIMGLLVALRRPSTSALAAASSPG